MSILAIALALLPQAQAEPVAPIAVQSFMKAAPMRDAQTLENIIAPDAQALELLTLFELLGQEPFQYEVLMGSMQHGDRTLSSIQVRSRTDNKGSEFWFWLTGEGAGQKIYSVIGDSRYSREWLYETPKGGQASTPAQAAKNLFEAMQAGDPMAAERACSDLAWRKDGGDLSALFQTARTTGLGFSTEEPRTKKGRSVVTFGFEFDGKRQGEAALFLEYRGEGWIATGFDDDKKHADDFLAGRTAATVWPKSPFDAYQFFATAVEKNQPIRLARLSATPFWIDEDGAAPWHKMIRMRTKIGSAPETVRVKGGRAIASIQELGPTGREQAVHFLHWAQQKEGWRLIAVSTTEEEAELYLDPEAAEKSDKPKPR